MKISIDDIRRIIKEELAAGAKPAEQDEKAGDTKPQTPKIADATAAAAAKAGEKNVYVQKGAQKAAEKGGAALMNSVLADFSKYTKNNVGKKELMQAIKQALAKMPNE